MRSQRFMVECSCYPWNNPKLLVLGLVLIHPEWLYVARRLTLSGQRCSDSLECMSPCLYRGLKAGSTMMPVSGCQLLAASEPRICPPPFEWGCLLHESPIPFLKPIGWIWQSSDYQLPWQVDFQRDLPRRQGKSRCLESISDRGYRNGILLLQKQGGIFQFNAKRHVVRRLVRWWKLSGVKVKTNLDIRSCGVWVGWRWLFAGRGDQGSYLR